MKVSPLLKRDDIGQVSKRLLDMGFNIERSVTAREGATAKRLRGCWSGYAAKEGTKCCRRSAGYLG